MDSLKVERVSKCYRRGAEFAPWQQVQAWLRRKPAGGAPKRTREIWALKDVSFSVAPGTILGIIGPNGAGKTTLLKVLARITPPTEGRVTGRGSLAPLLEIGTGLQPDLTARENIVLYAAWHGISRADVQKRMDDIVEFAGIQEFLDSPLKHFSSGMYVRLAFSIAVNMYPDILLADEVLAVGDLTFQERCLQRVEEAGRAGMTVLFVSHDMAAIQRLCQRVIWLNAGQVVEDGDPETVVGHYEQAAWTLTAGTARQGRKGSHVNAHGEILAVRLLSADGREIGAARRDEQLSMALTYSLLTPGAIVRCAMSIWTRGILAFRAVQPEEWQVTEPGIFRASVRIPPHLLADTIYTVKTGILIYVDGQESALVQDNGLTFRVYAEDQDTQRSLLARGFYKGSSWSGAVMPHLDWEVVRERDVVRV
jgi:ABC-type polysaccharide/polyol phosphate transport system ATPase subunit